MSSSKQVKGINDVKVAIVEDESNLLPVQWPMHKTTITNNAGTPQEMKGFVLDEQDEKRVVLPSDSSNAKSKRLEQIISTGRKQWDAINDNAHRTITINQSIPKNVEQRQLSGNISRRWSRISNWIKEKTQSEQNQNPTTADITYSHMTQQQQQKVRSLIIDLGFALATYGVPAPRIEHLLGIVSTYYGVNGTYYALPTVIWYTFAPGDKDNSDHANDIMHYVRLKSGAINLNKQAQLDHLCQSIADGELDDIDLSCERVREIVEAKQMYARIWVPIINTLFIAASICFLLGGTWAEILTAAIGGILVGIINHMRGTSHFLSKVGMVIASFAVGVVAILLAAGLYSRVHIRIDPLTSAISSILVLVPSAQIAMAIQELNAGTFLSGAIRLASIRYEFSS
jgi:uncharacterized membrane protein YjjP (DUF1212 family)